MVGVTVGRIRTGVAVFDPVAVGVNRAEAVGDGVVGGRVGTTTNGVRFGSRPALGAFRETTHSRTIMSAEATAATRAPRNPRRVRTVAAARSSATRNHPGSSLASHRHAILV